MSAPEIPVQLKIGQEAQLQETTLTKDRKYERSSFVPFELEGFGRGEIRCHQETEEDVRGFRIPIASPLGGPIEFAYAYDEKRGEINFDEPIKAPIMFGVVFASDQRLPQSFRCRLDIKGTTFTSGIAMSERDEETGEWLYVFSDWVNEADVEKGECIVLLPGPQALDEVQIMFRAE